MVTAAGLTVSNIGRGDQVTMKRTNSLNMQFRATLTIELECILKGRCLALSEYF